MDNGKSKEELLADLKRSNEIISDLKAILTANENLNREQIKNERFLSQTAMELAELPYGADIYKFTALKLREFFDDSIILVTAYDEQSDLFGLVAIEGINQKWKDKLKKILGNDYLNSKVSFNELDEKYQKWFFSREFFRGGLYEVTGAIFPKTACEIVERAMNLTEIFSISLIWEEKLYGTVAIFLKNKGVSEKKETVKTLVNMVAVALQRKNAEERVKKDLEEKKLLMKETHHRVKNNLMVISSLLNIQSRYIKDKDALDIFRQSQDRARTMALIHEMMYSSTDLKHIDFGDYTRKLATSLFRTYLNNSNSIKLNLKLEEQILDINSVIPLGLILNELISNSLKHAFPDVSGGEIMVSFYKEDNFYHLNISDNGVGFPNDFDFKNTDSLGLRLVNSLTEQIHGKLELNKVNGTEFKISFKELFSK